MFFIGRKTSYQLYDDFCVIINHNDGSDYKLNKSAAEIFKKIESGHIDFSSEELEFIDELISAGVVFDGEETENNSDALLESSGLESSVWSELNEFASLNIIPVTATLELTYRCPVNCIHCYIDRSAVVVENELSFKEYVRFIDEFRSMGGLYLILTGGDPFLHRDFEKIFNYARSKHIAVSVMSSGYGCDKPLLKRISNLGLMSFQATLHGHNNSIHDRFTKVDGSFEKTLDTLRTMKGLGVYVQAAVSINTNNIKHFNQIISFLESEKMNYVFNYEMLPKRTGDKSPAELNISENELSECYSKTGISQKHRLSGKLPDDPPCNAARSLFSIDPSGRVFPCIELRVCAGDIKNGSFLDIWKNSTVLNDIRHLKFKDLSVCSKCELKDMCNRCPGNSLREGLDITDHSARDCFYAGINSQVKRIKSLQ